MKYRDCFANSYLKARENFLTACTSTATWIKSWQNPLRGIQGEKLYLDLAWFGAPDAAKVLILLSGTHGIEGYCGSGIQVASMRSDWHLQANNEVAIAMIHSLNPYGMSYWRRVNEAGVDLNRNFIDFQQPLPKNQLYDDLVEAIVPQQWTDATQRHTLEQIMDYLHRHPSAIGDLARGQYRYWYAPFYGGEVPTWSNLIFNQIAERYLKNRKIVGLLDYHTGLGQYATGQLISSSDRDKNQPNIAAEIWGDKLVIAGSAKSVAAYSPQGTSIAALQAKLGSTTCVAAAYEFGTIPETEVFHALRADHWLQAYGDLDNKQAKDIKQQMLDAFYCDRPDWQESICNLAFTAQAELFRGLKDY